MSEAPAVGIDLGTTNSAVAAVVGRHPSLLPDPSGNVLLPSVVGFDAQGGLLVGRPARNQLLVAPERTVRSVKRAMGSDRVWAMEGRSWTPVEISAVVLRTLVDQAAAALGSRPTRAVITVPAFFTDLQRQATRDAGTMAGLEVLRLVNEPTAAALTYEADGDTLALVYDLGGGTFDVSVVEVGQDFTEVRASRGDTALGGDDIDLAFARLIASTWRHPEAEQDPIAWARLTAAAERAKIALSERTTVRVRESFLLGDLHLDLVLTREQLEDVARPIVEPTLRHVSDALADAGLVPANVHRLVLVGGQTKMPLVRTLLEEALDIPIHADVEPDTAVALGAGLLAGRLTGESVDALLVDVTPHTLAAGVLRDLDEPDLMALPIIPRNTVVPATRSHVAYTVYPGQKEVRIPIGQGESPRFDALTTLGEVRLAGLTGKGAHQPVEIRFHLDASGVLTATAVERHSGREAEVVIADSPYALAERRRAGGARAVEDAVAASSSGLDDLRIVARRMLDQAGRAHPEAPDRQAALQAAIQALEAALETTDADAIGQASDALADLLLELV